MLPLNRSASLGCLSQAVGKGLGSHAIRKAANAAASRLASLSVQLVALPQRLRWAWS